MRQETAKIQKPSVQAQQPRAVRTAFVFTKAVKDRDAESSTEESATKMVSKPVSKSGSSSSFDFVGIAG